MREQIAKILRQTDGGLALQCHIQPGASKNAFKGVHGDALKFAIKAPPVDGKANAALREFLADELDVPKSSVEIVSGESSRGKRIHIKNITADDFLRTFADK